jgi:hypothetical protein
MEMEQAECSETSAIKHLTLENNPKNYTRRNNSWFVWGFKSETVIGSGGFEVPECQKVLYF